MRNTTIAPFALITFACAALFAPSPVAARHAHTLTTLPPSESWVGTWETGLASAPLTYSPPEISDQTVRQIVFTHYGGNYVRVRLSNQFGREPLTIGAATVALSAGGATLNPSTLRTLTFNGSQSVTLAPGTKVFSDPVALQVSAGANLAISYFVKALFRATTWHVIAEQQNYISAQGDHTQDTGGGQYPYGMTVYIMMDGVDVGVTAGTGAVVALGDSITDGYGSTFGANLRWPDQFASLLQQAQIPVSVLNAGISGGRVLSDSPCAGKSALHRFDTDVAQQSGARYVVLLEGINDIALSNGYALTQFSCYSPDPRIKAGNIINGYQTLIADAHNAGLLIYGATLIPASMTGGLEDMRTTVNTWTRTSGAFDAVIDFDAAVRNPSMPSSMLPQYDSGDHVHPSDAGYAAMAQAIPLSLFSSASPPRGPGNAGRGRH